MIETQSAWGGIVDEHMKAWQETTLKSVAERLERRGIRTSCVERGSEAVAFLMAAISSGSSVYRCGSTSTTEIGLWEALKEREDLTILDPYRPDGSPDLDGASSLELRRQGLLADVMITSCNALTLDGQIVNLDGMGNRVAAMSFGPRQVFLVVGINKIVSDLDEARARIRRFVAPVNARRVGAPTPCVKTGRCEDCDSPRRICRSWSILEGQSDPNRMHVFLVGEVLGY